MVAFIQMMADAHCDVRPYVVIGTITTEQYKTITGEDYVAATSEAPASSSAASDSAAPAAS